MILQAEWLSGPRVQALFTLLNGAGHQLHAVGGCVRNTLLNQPVADVDLACSAPPETVMALAKAAGYRVLPTGIEHGTVTVLIDAQGFEITTWRHDVSTDGRRATVAYAKTLHDDAARRDFTMNALYVGADGVILDPVGGLGDLYARHVRFIGDATTRIAEDYLRILRYFRFYAWYGDPQQGPDPDALDAIMRNLDGLAGLSGERIGAEMARLLAAPDPAPALALMAQTGVLGALLAGADTGLIAPLVHLEQAADVAPRWQRRLAALGNDWGDDRGDHRGGDGWAGRLRLSRADARALEHYRAAASEAPTLAAVAFEYGADVARDYALISAAAMAQAPQDGWAHEIARGAGAVFPLRAVDLPHLSGPALGAELKRLQRVWLASNLTLDRAALLAR